MVLVDTNILLDAATRDPVWFAWFSSKLAPVINAGEAAINPIIYSELAPGFASEHELDSTLLPPDCFHRLHLPYAAAFPAARAFIAYRKSGGARTSPLPDFFIGAHAEVEGHTILTRDTARYRSYFPAVKLICPP